MSQSQDINKTPDGLTGIPKEIIEYEGISIPVYDFEGFRPNLSLSNDTIYIINFWATWCKPCIEELPHFLKVSEENRTEKVTFIYVSLDFRRNLETVVIPFLKSRNMTKNVILLNDPDANGWIDQVDPAWSGSIPATLIYTNNKRKFFEKPLFYQELNLIIHTLSNSLNENN